MYNPLSKREKQSSHGLLVAAEKLVPFFQKDKGLSGFMSTAYFLKLIVSEFSTLTFFSIPQ